ncbi:hypothetical protein ACC734_38905, partial [Rhizobium ruizarguesonis]
KSSENSVFARRSSNRTLSTVMVSVSFASGHSDDVLSVIGNSEEAASYWLTMSDYDPFSSATATE